VDNEGEDDALRRRLMNSLITLVGDVAFLAAAASSDDENEIGGNVRARGKMRLAGSAIVRERSRT